MFVTRCPLCEHVNPEHSKFCNVCGVSLLRTGVCARCGALNEVTAPTCHQCAAVLLERGSQGPAEAAAKPADSATEPNPAPEPDVASHSHRSPHRRTGLSTLQRALIAGTALGAVVGAFGYFTYTQSRVVDVSGLLPALPDVHAGMLPPAAAPWPADDPAPLPKPISGAAPSATGTDVPAARSVRPCTAGVAALGLCAFESTQAKE